MQRALVDGGAARSAGQHDFQCAVELGENHVDLDHRATFPVAVGLLMSVTEAQAVTGVEMVQVSLPFTTVIWPTKTCVSSLYLCSVGQDKTRCTMVMQRASLCRLAGWNAAPSVGQHDLQRAVLRVIALHRGDARIG